MDPLAPSFKKPWNRTKYWRGIRIQRHSDKSITYLPARALSHLPRDAEKWVRTASITKSEAMWTPILMRVWHRDSQSRLIFATTPEGHADLTEVEESFQSPYNHPDLPHLQGQERLRCHAVCEQAGRKAGFVAMTSSYEKMRLYAKYFTERLPEKNDGLVNNYDSGNNDNRDVYITFIATGAFENSPWKLLRLAEEHATYNVEPKCKNGEAFPYMGHWDAERKTTILAVEAVPKEAIVLTLTWAELKDITATELKWRLIYAMGWEEDSGLLRRLERLWHE